MSFRLSPSQLRLKYRRRSSQLDEMPRPSDGSGESSEQKGNNYSYSIQTSSMSFASRDMSPITASGASNSLFYAYARRTDHDKFSRYILIFENADVADEWWSLVEQEYPEAAARNGPQFFTFSGDDFPAKPAASKQFAHLKTRWMYGQVGDATGANGKSLDPIPLQDAKGFPIISGGVVGVPKIDTTELSGHLNRLQETIEENSSHVKELADGQRENQDQIKALVKGQSEEKDKTKELGEQSTSQMKDLVEKLVESQISSQKKMDEMIEQNTTQVKKLTEDYDAIIKRMETALEKNNAQIKELAERNNAQIKELAERNNAQVKGLAENNIAQIKQLAENNTAQIKQLAENNTAQIKELSKNNTAQIKELAENQKRIQQQQAQPAPPSKTNDNSATTKALQSAINQNASQIKQISEGQEKLIAAFGDMLGELKQQNKQQQMFQPPPPPPSSSGATNCQVHNVHPPPRKIGRTIIGYDYEPSPAKASGSSTSPPSPVAPKRVSSLAKGRTQSEQSVTRAKTPA